VKKKQTKGKKYRIIFVLGLILWLGIIFLFSSEQNLHSSFSYNVDLILRKIAHIIEYFILTFLVYKALFFFKNHSLTSIFLVSLSYAFLDEWHQSFVVGREGTIRDVAFDLIGILLCVYFIRKLKKDKTTVNKSKTGQKA
jgi:hypothetical protein